MSAVVSLSVWMKTVLETSLFQSKLHKPTNCECEQDPAAGSTLTLDSLLPMETGFCLIWVIRVQYYYSLALKLTH